MDLPFHPSGLEGGVPTPCWCFQTMQLFGPDSNVASEESCGPDRDCYEAPAKEQSREWTR